MGKYLIIHVSIYHWLVLRRPASLPTPLQKLRHFLSIKSSSNKNVKPFNKSSEKKEKKSGDRTVTEMGQKGVISPAKKLFSWVRRQSKKVKIFLGLTTALTLLVTLKLVVHDHNYFFVMAEAIHLIGLLVLIYKLTTLKTCSGNFSRKIFSFLVIKINSFIFICMLLFFLDIQARKLETFVLLCYSCGNFIDFCVVSLWLSCFVIWRSKIWTPWGNFLFWLSAFRNNFLSTFK